MTETNKAVTLWGLKSTVEEAERGWEGDDIVGRARDRPGRARGLSPDLGMTAGVGKGTNGQPSKSIVQPNIRSPPKSAGQSQLPYKIISLSTSLHVTVTAAVHRQNRVTGVYWKSVESPSMPNFLITFPPPCSSVLVMATGSACEQISRSVGLTLQRKGLARRGGDRQQSLDPSCQTLVNQT